MADRLPSCGVSAFRGGAGVLFVTLFLAGLSLTGCVPARARLSPLERQIEAAARPILTMDPNVVWTDSYNRLRELGPDSIAYLAEHPTLREPAAPDDLRVMLHTSLLRMLAHPSTRPPLTANCLETSLDLLHFDLKVAGHRLGTVVQSAATTPATWHALYPADFGHALAAHIDVEADRQALRAWWLLYRDRPQMLINPSPLRPRTERIWTVLPRRYADRWSYVPRTHVVRCGDSPEEPALFHGPAHDYNLVRAACVWLGSSEDPAIRDRLIGLVASPSPVVAHNAIFALGFARDPRIREVLDRYNNKEQSRPRDEPVAPDSLRVISRLNPGDWHSDA